MLVRHYHAGLAHTDVETVLQEVPPLLTEADLHIAQLAMTLLSSVCQTCPQAMPTLTQVRRSFPIEATTHHFQS